MSEHIPEWITNLAADIYKIIQRHKALPHFQEMVNTWAEGHETEINDLRKWQEQRALHFEETIAADVRLQNEQTGPPGDGWQFQNHVQHTEKQTESGLQRSHNIIQGWVPPELATRPEITQILPLNRDHALSLVEKYTVLATIYDYGRKGTDKLPPWKWPDLSEEQTPGTLSDAKKCLSFEVLSQSVENLVPAEENWLRIMLDNVEADLANWVGMKSIPEKQQTDIDGSETLLDRVVRRAKNKRVISIIIIVFLVITAIGTVVEKFESIVVFVRQVTGQQGETQTERGDDQPILSATATVQIAIRSEEQVNARRPYQGAILTFGKGTEALLRLSSEASKAMQTGMDEVRYSSELHMKTTDMGFKQPLSLLQQVEYAQVKFEGIPPNSDVLSGTVICIFNSNISFELSIPPQKMRENIISIPDIGVAEALQQHTRNQ